MKTTQACSSVIRICIWMADGDGNCHCKRTILFFQTVSMMKLFEMRGLCIFSLEKLLFECILNNRVERCYWNNDVGEWKMKLVNENAVRSFSLCMKKKIESQIWNRRCLALPKALQFYVGKCASVILWTM